MVRPSTGGGGHRVTRPDDEYWSTGPGRGGWYGAGGPPVVPPWPLRGACRESHFLLAYTPGMERTFRGVLWASFKSVYGPVIAVVGLVGALVVYVFAFPDDILARLAVAGAIGILTVALVLLFTLYNAAHEMYEANASPLPRVIHGMEPFAGMDVVLVCVLEPSQLFSPDILVALYKMNRQDIEEPIGVGTVVNVQDDGKIQVAMTQVFWGHTNYADRLKRNEAAALESTRVKPNVPRRMFDLQSRGGSQ